MKPFAVFGSLLALAFAASSQFSSDVNVVTLLATVRDPSGAVVKGLNKDDFVLEENGQPQEIRYFSRESDLPLKIALLIDTSRSMDSVFEPERVAAHRFFGQVLRTDKDVGAVVHFDTKVETLQDFTSSRDLLDTALARLKIPGRVATLLYDGIAQSSRNLMERQSGRKAIILLSDGLDFRSNASIGTAIEYAQRADTIIYAVHFDRARIPRRKRLSEEVMQRLARETGGGYYVMSDASPINQIYDQIESELRSQYSIGYTPSTPAKSGEYRKVRLTAVRQGLTVRTRDGYYGK